MLYYGSADVEAHVPNSARIAVLFFHGAMRNAIDYFCSLRSIMEAQSSLQLNNDDTSQILMLTLKYAYSRDLFDEYEGRWRDLYWNGSKPWGDYRIGGSSAPQS